MSLRFSITLLFTVFLFSFKSAAQDTLIFEGLYPFIVDVQEERPRKVLYKKLDLLKSPTYIIDKRYITEIRYHDAASAAQKFKPEPLVDQQPLEVLILPTDSNEAIRGEMIDLTDTSLVLEGKRLVPVADSMGLPALVDVFHYKKIRTVEVRQRDRMRRNALWGALGGFAIGTLTGLAIFDDTPPCDPTNIDGMPCDDSLLSPRTKWEKSLLLGAGVGGVGMVSGGIIGSVKIRIPISGRQDAFNAAIPRLERLARGKR